ncbi:hypothetical protein PS645_04172 [Pseudomonas fluorescens]|uniref:Transmembrane protein n=1 Tax=Pseudomonas fluorescens TaxID=294 RepID=A0A5E6VN41_PSEFL|nr:hypothetical protein [Pseudomonas fluorescens]VVN18421.1 hypothetical protein PS645_04172 [Pseudomonas fluorescens]
MHDIDPTDFNKARGFLIGYSGIVLALWFFGAKLEKFQLMGTEIQLGTNVGKAWLVLCLLNVYLWWRYYLRIPALALFFDDAMQNLYDASLRWAAIRLQTRSMKARLREMFAEDPNGAEAVEFYRGRGMLTCHGKIEADNMAHPESTDIRYVSREFRTEVRLWFDYRVRTKEGWNPFWSEAQLCIYKPSVFITWPIKAFVIVRGAFVTPWLTDYVIPLVWGAASSIAALWMYLHINNYLRQ